MSRWTRDQIAIIGKNPHVLKFSENGGMLILEKEFLKQLYEAWSVKKSLKTIISFLKPTAFL